ncbi:MAG: DUF4349 domain-containing protein [Lentisphaeria bacterium]|nr:DUF4349 domain-containing protein [Lentisphaeria bacterium]
MKKIMFCLFCSAILSGCTGIDSEIPRPESAAYDTAAPKSKSLHSSRRAAASGAVNSFSKDSAFFQESSRMMAYTSGFTLTVKERNKAMDEIKKAAESMGGYLVSRNRGNMTVKVPVKKADSFLKQSRGVGKLSDFRVSAEDLTDTITDIDVRLENLKKLRQRLAELLKKANKVEEILKVERELNRVTTEIERVEAQLQNNRSRVANVTFEIAVIEEHGAIPGGNPQAISHFQFLHNLASTRPGKKDKPLFGLALPENLVPVTGSYNTVDGFTATGSDDCILRIWEEKIPDTSTLEFWQQLVCRSLTTIHCFDNVKCFPATFNGNKAVRITAIQNTARGIMHYTAVITIDRWGWDELRIVEFYGPEKAFEKHIEKVLSVIPR